MTEPTNPGPGAPTPTAVPHGTDQRPRRWWLAAGAVGIAAGAAGSWWSSSRQAPSAGPAPAGLAGTSSDARQLGEDFWALSLPQADGTPLAVGTLRGGPLLVNFWATWCPPCVKEMPLLDAFYKQYNTKNLKMLGIAIDGPTAVKAFLGKTPVTFPIALAGVEGTGLARTLGNAQGALPYTVLATPDGRIVQRQMGELTAEQLSTWAQQLRLSA